VAWTKILREGEGEDSWQLPNNRQNQLDRFGNREEEKRKRKNRSSNVTCIHSQFLNVKSEPVNWKYIGKKRRITNRVKSLNGPVIHNP
jgi:hypothetical protein